MQENQEYLDQKHEEFKVYLEKKLTAHQENLQLELNKKMLENIEFGKAKIEEAFQYYSNQYKQKMERLIERRNLGNMRDYMFDLNVKIYKRAFEGSLQLTIRNWIDFIKKSEANIK